MKKFILLLSVLIVGMTASAGELIPVEQHQSVLESLQEAVETVTFKNLVNNPFAIYKSCKAKVYLTGGVRILTLNGQYYETSDVDVRLATQDLKEGITISYETGSQPRFIIERVNKGTELLTTTGVVASITTNAGETEVLGVSIEEYYYRRENRGTISQPVWVTARATKDFLECNNYSKK